MCVCSLCFLFVRYGDHRDLHVLTHAFPTRRSSDLARPPRVIIPCPVGRNTTSTPTSPTKIAAQRRGPTFPPRIGTAIAVTSRGATKLIAYAVVRGSNRTPYTQPATSAPPSTPPHRTTAPCHPSRPRPEKRRVGKR